MSAVTEYSDDKMKIYDSRDFYIGLGLAISSSGFIGSSFIIKKKALIKLQRYGLRAGAGGFGYLREWIWWAGLLSMGIGEAANFAAYAFAPASLVTPLGALSVLVTALLASRYLNERLNLLGKIGCLLCIIGSTVIVLHSPKEEEVENSNELFEKLTERSFVAYTFLIIICTLLIIFHYGPKYGREHIAVYIFLCASVGSLTVMSCKGLGLALKETIAGNSNEFENWLTWMFLTTVILCIVIQMNYLNKSLDLFDASIVTPIYYVIFTMFVIVASALLFREWENMSGEDIVGSICGFLTVVVGIFLLNAFKEMNINYNNIKHMLRPKKVQSMNYNQWNSRDQMDEERLVQRIDLNYGSPEIS